MGGPGVVQFSVRYGVNYRADSGPEGFQLFAGASVFTIFMTGRIVRFDTFVPFVGEALMMTPNPFGCAGNADNFFLTSYWSFDGASSRQLDATGQRIPPDNDPAACTYFENDRNMIAVAWPTNPTPRTRYGVNSNSTHVYDFIPQSSPMVPAAEYSVRSRLQLASGVLTDAGCPDLLTRLEEFPLSINGIDLTPDADGIYRDARPHENETVTVSTGGFPFPGGFTLSLQIGESNHVRIDGPVPVIQRDGSTAVLVFPDAIAPQSTIAIELF